MSYQLIGHCPPVIWHEIRQTQGLPASWWLAEYIGIETTFTREFISRFELDRLADDGGRQ